MTSPSSTASSPIQSDAYFVDLYPLASPAHSRSPSPIYHFSPSSAQFQQSNPDRKHNHIHNNNHKHNPSSHNNNKLCRPAPYRPRLDFTPVPTTQAPFRPTLSFLDTASTSPSSASPLTPESPVEGGEGEKYSCVKKEEEERGSKEDRISAQKMKRRAQNRVAQRAFRARQTERVAELEREVEGLREELEVLKERLRGVGE